MHCAWDTTMQLFVKVILDYLQCTSFVFLEYEGFLVQCMREKPRLKSRGLKLNWSLACSAAALTWLLCNCVLKIEISESHHDGIWPMAHSEIVWNFTPKKAPSIKKFKPMKTKCKNPKTSNLWTHLIRHWHSLALTV